MKKTSIALTAIIIILVALSTCVYAATAKIELTSSTSTLSAGKEVVITLKATNLEGVSNVRGFEGMLKYDTDIFESVEINPGEINNDVNNKEFGHMAGTISGQNAEITITLKVKPQVKSANTTVTVSKFVVMDDAEVSTDKTSASITFKVTGNIDDDNSSGNVGNNNNELGNNVGNKVDDGKNKINPTNSDKTTSGTKLPKTGVVGYMAVIIAIIAVIAVISIVRYKNIMK